ncbi:response regulator transcription factor [Frondihabitans cladoniiphilus]|uniref:Response regulator transcription factor n=1 Tax=Frondihabitans cladoniiphilus TaxID=715785 RepID=A0ABP8W1F8_9MICO
MDRTRRQDAAPAAESASRILVVDDDPNIVLGLRTALEADGYEVAVADDGLNALSAVASASIDAIVLDVGLPRLDGLAVCRSLRGLGHRVPILLLTAHDRPRDRVSGLDAGADDYLGKPFDLDELLARVRALVRRNRPPDRARLSHGELCLDTEQRLLLSPRDAIALTRIETVLLKRFFEEPGRTHPRASLVEAVWGGQEGPRSNALEVYLSQLRSKLALAGAAGLVVTVRGLGYRLASS